MSLDRGFRDLTKKLALPSKVRAVALGQVVERPKSGVVPVAFVFGAGVP
jgi:hypothetical protein